MISALEVLSRFEELLRKRLELGQSEDHLKEDDIQNSLNFSLAEAGAIPEPEIRLEFEHAGISGKQLDSYVRKSPPTGRRLVKSSTIAIHLRALRREPF